MAGAGVTSQSHYCFVPDLASGLCAEIMIMTPEDGRDRGVVSSEQFFMDNDTNFKTRIVSLVSSLSDF